MTTTPRKTTPVPMPDREIMNIDAAAAFLGVSVKTFSKVLREGDVPGRKVGREWKFSRQALIAWVGTSRSDAFLDNSDEGLGEAEAEASRRRPAGDRGGSAPPPGTGGAARKRRPDGFSVDEI